VEEIITILDALKKSGITHLNLGDNSLSKKTTPEIITIFDTLKHSGVTHLHLCNKEFLGKTAEELATILSTLKNSGITHLDLSYCELWGKTIEELVIILGALKNSGVTDLDLSWNNLGSKTAEELTTLFTAISFDIESVRFGLYELQWIALEQRQAIQTRFPDSEHIILINGCSGKGLNPTCSRVDANIYRKLGFKMPPPAI